MSEEKNCYIHKDVTTRLSCNACGKPICPKCMVNAAVGYKCRDCGQRNISHIEKITHRQYLSGALLGLIVGIGAGYIWNFLSSYGIFVSLLVAYAVGFCISRAITKVVGNKIGRRIQILAGIITVISMVYNPIILLSSLVMSIPIFSMITYVTYQSFGNLISLLAVIIAVWSAIRHFKF